MFLDQYICMRMSVCVCNNGYLCISACSFINMEQQFNIHAYN